jgi:hypothetical protein
LGKDTPHETPPMRHNTSNVPQLNLDTGTSASAEDCGPISETNAANDLLNEETVSRHHGNKSLPNRIQYSAVSRGANCE